MLPDTRPDSPRPVSVDPSVLRLLLSACERRAAAGRRGIHRPRIALRQARERHLAREETLAVNRAGYRGPMATRARGLAQRPGSRGVLGGSDDVTRDNAGIDPSARTDVALSSWPGLPVTGGGRPSSATTIRGRSSNLAAPPARSRSQPSARLMVQAMGGSQWRRIWGRIWRAAPVSPSAPSRPTRDTTAPCARWDRPGRPSRAATPTRSGPPTARRPHAVPAASRVLRRRAHSGCVFPVGVPRDTTSRLA